MPIVTRAAFHLGRHVSHPFTLQYLQRNYHVIKTASLVLALGCFDEIRKHFLGGTGWSVAMAQLLIKLLYFFDLDVQQSRNEKTDLPNVKGEVKRAIKATFAHLCTTLTRDKCLPLLAVKGESSGDKGRFCHAFNPYL